MKNTPEILFLKASLVILLYGSGLSTGQPVGTTVVEGDIYVHVIAAIYTETNSTGHCVNIEAETVQQLEAIKWIFEELNGINYIPGVEIGVRVSETCGSIEMAKKVALDLSAELAVDETNMRTVGVIGHDYSSESEVISKLFSSLPDKLRLLQMSYSATALSLRDRQTYTNFFRLIPPDDLQVEAVRGFIKSMNYTYMALVYSDDAYGRGLKDLLHSSIDVNKDEICIPVSMPISSANDTVAFLEDLLRDQLINASPPISGVLVFVPYTVTENILIAIRNVLSNSNSTPPVFIFSEANAYISDEFIDLIKGSFVLNPRRKVIQQFGWTNRVSDLSRLYTEARSNKWLRDMYKLGFNCELADAFINNTCDAKNSSEIRSVFPDSSYNQYSIQTALTIAKVIKDTYNEVCTSGLCSEFLSLPRGRFVQKADSLTVEYDDDFGAFEIEEFKNPDLEIEFNHSTEVILKTNLPLYEVYNFKICDSSPCQIKVASLSNMMQFDLQQEDVTAYFDNQDAQCQNGHLCESCSKISNAHAVLFSRGDLYIIGIAPIHEKGETPLQCGDFKRGGLDIAEAIRYAVLEENLDASVGVIIIDSCNDPQIVQENVLTLHRLGILVDGSYIPVADKIIGYIGGWTSDVSIAVAEVTTRLKIPQISYASTATSLSRRSLYKYFLRIPTPDNEQGRVMIDIAKDQIKTNFVQILYSETEYGEGGRDNLIARARELSICVSQTIGVGETTDITTIVPRLRQQKDAKLVLMFLGSNEVSKLLEILNNEIQAGEFEFIASEGWGRRFNVASFDILVGAITLTSELDISDKFTDWMSDLSIEETHVNFWIRPYIEWYFGCYSKWSFDKTLNTSCSDTLALDVSTGYRVEVWSAFTERAVTALLNGARQAMTQYCGNSRIICDALRNNTDGFVDLIRSQTYFENGNNIRIFDNNGDGRAGYRIYVVSNQPTEEYFQIGQVNPDSAIFFETNKYLQRGGRLLNFTCSGQPKCLDCFPVIVPPDEESSLPVGLIVVLVLLGILCCILGATLLYICNKYGCCIKIEKGRLRIVDYITPVYRQETRPPIDGEDYNYISDSDVGRDSMTKVNNTHTNSGYSRSGSEQASNQTNSGSSGSRSGSRSGYGLSNRDGSNSRTHSGYERQLYPNNEQLDSGILTQRGSSASNQVHGDSDGSRSGVVTYNQNTVTYRHDKDDTNHDKAENTSVDPAQIHVPLDLTVPRDEQHQFNTAPPNPGYLNPVDQ